MSYVREMSDEPGHQDVAPGGGSSSPLDVNALIQTGAGTVNTLISSLTGRAPTAPAPAPSSGSKIPPLLIVAGLGIGAIVLFRFLKKKKE